MELTVTVGTGWTYIGAGEALRLKGINAAGCAVIEIARADVAFPDSPRLATVIIEDDPPRPIIFDDRDLAVIDAHDDAGGG